jgi:hypothetical protein
MAPCSSFFVRSHPSALGNVEETIASGIVSQSQASIITNTDVVVVAFQVCCCSQVVVFFWNST